MGRIMDTLVDWISGGIAGEDTDPMQIQIINDPVAEFAGHGLPRLRGCHWLGQWLVDWDRHVAYQPLNDGQYLVFTSESGRLIVQSEIEVPMYILEIIAPGRDRGGDQ